MPNNKWVKCSPNKIFYEHSSCWWQRCLYYKNENETVYVDIVEYKIDGKKTYMVDMQIPEELSIIGETINVRTFTYYKLDFPLMEKHARKIIKSLVK